MDFDQFKTCVISEVRAIYPRAFSDNLSIAESDRPSDPVSEVHPANVAAAPATEGKPKQPEPEVPSVQDLLELDDHLFVRRCYQVLLKREPDSEGFQHYLHGLRQQTLDKLQIVLLMMRSPEGQQAKVSLRGVQRERIRAVFRRFPIIGTWIECADALKRLPRMQQRIETLEIQLSNPTAVHQASKSNESTQFLSSSDYDKFYLEFENEFRGSRHTVKSRHKVYLSDIAQLTTTLGAGPILDIACGRGEWLELLREHNYQAEGVDINSASLAECTQRGLTVHQRDAFEFLKDVSDGTYLAVTAFHLIEHLPLDSMLHLIDEIERVLVPGGKIILETPNPGNLVVGAQTFYIDPTHERPLPPILTQFAVRQRGFAEAIIRPLHPAYEESVLAGFQGADMLNDLLFGCQDYAVIGTKK